MSAGALREISGVCIVSHQSHQSHHNHGRSHRRRHPSTSPSPIIIITTIHATTKLTIMIINRGHCTQSCFTPYPVRATSATLPHYGRHAAALSDELACLLSVSSGALREIRGVCIAEIVQKSRREIWRIPESLHRLEFRKFHKFLKCHRTHGKSLNFEKHRPPEILETFEFSEFRGNLKDIHTKRLVHIVYEVISR